MKITIKQLIGWEMAKTAALATIGKTPVNLPTDKWVRDMMLSEHSPCRVPTYWIEMRDIPYYVAMHLVRHKEGVEWFCCTSREDRTGVPRDERKQTDLVTLSCMANAQAIMNISKKRLCAMADVETRKVWHQVRKEMYLVDSNLSCAMIPACKWQGRQCHEFRSCGRFNRTIVDYGEETESC